MSRRITFVVIQCVIAGLLLAAVSAIYQSQKTVSSYIYSKPCQPPDCFGVVTHGLFEKGTYNIVRRGWPFSYYSKSSVGSGRNDYVYQKDGPNGFRILPFIADFLISSAIATFVFFVAFRVKQHDGKTRLAI